RAGGIGHQAHAHAAVGRTAFAGLVFLDRLVFAQPNQIDLVGWNVVFRAEVLNYGRRTALAQTVVVVCGADGIRAAFHRDDVTLGVGDGGAQLVQFFFGLLGQKILVETKVDGGLTHNLVVVEV